VHGATRTDRPSDAGYDMEDAMILNKSGVDRGLAHGTVIKSEHVDLRDDKGRHMVFGAEKAGPRDAHVAPESALGQKFPQNVPGRPGGQAATAKRINVQACAPPLLCLCPPPHPGNANHLCVLVADAIVIRQSLVQPPPTPSRFAQSLEHAGGGGESHDEIRCMCMWGGLHLSVLHTELQADVKNYLVIVR